MRTCMTSSADIKLSFWGVMYRFFPNAEFYENLVPLQSRIELLRADQIQQFGPA